ncbi:MULTISPECIES: MOSC domain-containing protein [unclassified Paenibacillus]|uniref:MOSC domain-containing protein n=1 Tax=unclassified Paenibacillus TaxID=185978 RepID=UPI0027866DC5|nr:MULTISPECIES: MOSC domain-containing protein [unclassified Paenibacillus]MDQ0899352.1 uncharacterized protein YcbX [Paenibacillus sp. V4I7]MDQ0914669.1 uncharacterized protein YcbX [Paenibacillus sp. V4I5]
MRSNLEGRIKEIRRYPIKSVLGESLSNVLIDRRGLYGDRMWAIRNSSGKFGSGKTTRRFQKMDGLFKYKARYDGSIPIVTTPDGVEYRGNSEDVDEVLSKWLGFPVTLAREESISHFDEGPVSIITTSSLRMLSKQLGDFVDPRRFRANILIDIHSTGYIEDDWLGRTIKIGNTVSLKVVAPLQRCVMVNNAQEALSDDSRILRALTQNHDATFGVWATVETSGEIAVGDATLLL